MSGITNKHPYGEQGEEHYYEDLIESESMSATEGFFSGGPLHFCMSQNPEVTARIRCAVRIGDWNDFSAFLRNFYNYSSMNATDLSISGDRSYTDVSLACVDYNGYEDVTDAYRSNMEYYESRGKKCKISSLIALMFTDGVFIPTSALIFSNLEINYDPKINGLTSNAIINAVCELNGCFAVAGKGYRPSFIFKDILDDGSYATRPKDIQPSQYRNLVYADSEIATISGVVISNGDIQVSAGTVENPYIIRDNMLLYGKTEAELQSIADTLYNKVKNIKFTPASLEIIGMTSGLNLCDCLRVHKPDGDTFITYVLNLKTTGVRSPHMLVDSTCTKYLDDSVSPLKTSVKNLQAAQAKTEDDVEDLQLDNEMIKNTLIAQSERIDGKNTEVGLRMADDGTVYQVSAENPIITETTGQAIVAELQRIAEGGGSGSAPIETIKVDGTPLPIANKAVNIDLSGKVDKVSGKQLSAEDYTTAEKTKLAGIATGANKTTIKNDLTTTTTGSALDASQGKALADLISTVTADTSVHTASGTSLSLSTGKGGMRWQDDAIIGQTHKSPNMLNPTYETATNSGVTCTKNGDGTYTLNGTATREAYFNLQSNMELTLLSEARFNAVPSNASNVYVRMASKKGATFDANSSNSPIVNITSDDKIDRYVIVVANGATFSNVVIKPMLTTDTSLTYADYEPYGIHSAGDGYGCVDIGTLTFAKNSSTSNIFYYAAVPGMKSGASVITSDYKSIGTATDAVMGANSEDMIIATAPSNNTIKIRDNRYATVADFTNAMRGKMLTYELADNATPDTYAIVADEVWKNLCNFTTDGTMMPLPRTLPAGTYTLSADTSSNVSIGFRMSKTTSTSSDSTVVSKTASNNHVVLTIDTNHESNYVNLSGSTLKNIQIEKGSVATPYTPYSSKTYPIPLPHPIRGIGDVREFVRKVGQKWVEDTKFGVVDLGSVGYFYVSSAGFFVGGVPNGKIGSINAACAKYTLHNVDSYLNLGDKEFRMSLSSETASNIYIKDSNYTDADSLKASLAGVMLIYELATSTTEPLPNQAAMYELESYTEQTHIDTADGLATMNVEYGQSDLMATALNGERLASKAIVE